MYEKLSANPRPSDKPIPPLRFSQERVTPISVRIKAAKAEAERKMAEETEKKIQEYLAARAETDKADMASITTMSLARWKAAVGMTSGIMIEE